MLMSQDKIRRAFTLFNADKNRNHRYASFDYCYNYFQGFRDKRKLASNENMEKSCLTLGFYLASWGMYRGSSFILQRSLTLFKPLIEHFANDCNNELWNIDVNNYDDAKIKLLMYEYNKIRTLLIPGNARHHVLVTKIMLGVFGNVPAFDTFFCKGFSKISEGGIGFSVCNAAALNEIKGFYSENKNLINELQNNSFTYDFVNEGSTKRLYPIAKIIDMIGFSYGEMLSINR